MRSKLIALALLTVMTVCSSCALTDALKDADKRVAAQEKYLELVEKATLAAAEAQAALDRIEPVAEAAESAGFTLPAEATGNISTGLETAARRVSTVAKYVGVGGTIPGPQQPFVSTTETALGLLVLGLGALARFFRKRETAAKGAIKGIVAGVNSLDLKDKDAVTSAIGKMAKSDTGIDEAALKAAVSAAKAELNI